MSNMQWVSHSILKREVKITWYTVAKSPLRVGVGREPPLGSPVDLAVIRIKLQDKNITYIPGSSLKGVFRTTAIQLAKKKNLRVCYGVGKDVCTKTEKIEGITLEDFIEHLLRGGNTSEALKVFNEKACLLCKLFGAPGFSGHIIFMDAYPIDVNGNVIEVPLGIRTGIAIDRRTGAAYKGALYQVEYVMPGARFKTTILATNLPNYAIGLIAKILKLINEGYVKIGGFKTRGFGEVGIEDLELKIRGACEGTKLLSLDNFDKEIELADCAEISGTWLVAKRDNAWKCLSKLEEVWDIVKFT
ncbi:MAG: CRISPR-associated RAMP protein Csx7 [Desulfurococcaceae archaeon]|nr:CRISPR-associated RAMP protein Csx7 [Desulfurococcaceae archaeon]